MTTLTPVIRLSGTATFASHLAASSGCARLRPLEGGQRVDRLLRRPLGASPEAIDLEMPVNFTGTYAAIRAFVAVLIANGGGHIVTVLYLLSLASTPPIAGYSASKAAAHSLTQELRPVLAAQGISVHGVHPDGIDTDMFPGVDAPTPTAAAAASLLDGLADDLEDILPDPKAEAMAGPLADRPGGVQARLLRRRGSPARR
jgi:NAD(P)-dependent dehydrogenase (short-subunit alcohol dehydrogenase family)